MRVTDALDGLRQLYEEAYPDLIIAARELPMVNGEDPCVRIRQASYLPLIVLGSREEAAEVLELGADAYMIKPPILRELVARVRTLLRRKPRYAPPVDNPKLEIENRLPNDGDGSNGLTFTEFRLLACLILNNGTLLSYPRLISEVWRGKEVSRDTVHFYVRRLRQKLQGYSPCHIVNCRGVGYRLEEKEVAI